MTARRRRRDLGLVLGMALLLGACAGAPAASQTSSHSAPPDPTPVPGGPANTPASSLDPGGFQLPQPVCPAPAAEVAAPAVIVALGDDPPIVAAPGSATVSTCTTTSVTDTVGSDPTVMLAARAGDRLTVSVPAGWSILAWEGSDHPVAGEGTNVIQGVAQNPGPSIEIPVPSRSGQSDVGLTLSVVSDGGQVVGTVEARFRVEVN
jgi:hypothetical protein